MIYPVQKGHEYLIYLGFKQLDTNFKSRIEGLIVRLLFCQKKKLQDNLNFCILIFESYYNLQYEKKKKII